jgi:hypothetical protein
MSTSSNSDDNIDINSGSTQENYEASPLSNIIYFTILTIIYCVVTIIYLYTGNNIQSLKENSNNKIFLLIYIAFLLAGNYYLNLKTAKAICPNTDLYLLYSQILLITIAPWLIIFVILYFLLELFNGWIKPFSNTIGYMVVSFLGSRKIIQKLLNKKNGINGEKQTRDLKNVFKYIENHNEKFINEFTNDIVDYGDFIRQLKKDDIFISDDIENNLDIIELYKLISIKNIVGRIVWYILAGLLICSITFNYIINIKCSTSIDHNKRKIDNIYNK